MDIENLFRPSWTLTGNLFCKIFCFFKIIFVTLNPVTIYKPMNALVLILSILVLVVG